MIQYSLKCSEGHQFDSWFQSAAAYEKLREARHVACVVCGSERVEKALMTPRVANGETTAPRQPDQTPLSATKHPAEQALSAFRAHVEKTSDYVGGNFAKEARAMHLGETPERPIWGEARLEEAKALVEDGIPVAPLPFTPTRKSN
jgi:hypothetical protein